MKTDRMDRKGAGGRRRNKKQREEATGETDR